MCRWGRKKAGEPPLNCGAVEDRATGNIGPCKFQSPPLTAENEKLMWFFGKLSGAVTDGTGAINSHAIETAMRLYKIPEEEQPILFERLISFIQMTRRQGDKKSGESS